MLTRWNTLAALIAVCLGIWWWYPQPAENVATDNTPVPIEQYTVLPDSEDTPPTVAVNDTPNDNHNIDPALFAKVQQISEQIDRCWASVEDIRADSKQAESALEQLLKSEFTSAQQLSNALLFMAGSGMITHQRATELFEHIQMQRWYKDSTFFAFNADNPSALQTETFDNIQRLYSLLEAQDIDSIDAWIEDDPRFFNQPLRVANDERLLNFSSDTVIGARFEFLSSDAQDALIERFDLSALSIAAALQARASTRTIKKLLDHVEHPEHYYYQSNIHPENLLATALRLDRYDVVDLLLERPERFDTPLITSPVNHYLAMNLSRDTMFEEQLPLLKKLAEHGYHLRFTGSERHGNLSLQGFKYTGYTPEQIKKLLDNNVGITQFKQTDDASHLALSPVDKDQLRFAGNQIQQAKQQLRTQDKACGNLLAERQKHIPPVQQLDNIQPFIKDLTTRAERFSALKRVSPVAVDTYINQLQLDAALSPTLTEESQTLLDAVMNNHMSLSNLFANDMNLLPDQQRLLLPKLCERFQEQAVELAVEYRWYIAFDQAFDEQCFAQTSLSIDTKRQLSGSIYASPASRVYAAIAKRHYTKAIQLVEEGSPLHGYPDGRDSLALLLDHMILLYSRHKPPTLVQQLLALLLTESVLNDVHYRRLRRVQLLQPGLFEDLISTNPGIIDAERYPLNTYSAY